MKHLIFNQFGIFLGIKSQRLIVKKDRDILREYPLSRIKTIQINSKGVSFSSDLIYNCSSRGVKIFFIQNNSYSMLHTLHEHKSVQNRLNQYKFIESPVSIDLASALIIAKIKNQRATILYATRGLLDSVEIKIYLDKIDNLMYQLKNNSGLTKESIFGFEGSAANLYFTTIRALGLFPSTFDERTKRYSGEITNVALNYGYAILFNVIYKATINAGLDPYCGILHTLKSGKPSLVLDLMEEYRSFIVDRNIIKNKSKLESCSDFNKVKKDIASSILESLSRKHIYKKQKIMVESIIQKQLYKISGHFACQMKYKPYTFRW